MTSPISAANAYSTLARITSAGDASSTSGLMGTANKGPSFSSMVESAVTGLIEQGKESDSKAMAMAAGKADLIDVVTAVSETEVAVETLVSVRDKVIQAYEEIFRMPI